MPWCRDAMIADDLPPGTHPATAAKIAAVVHALCDQDGHAVPGWVMGSRSPYETTLVPGVDLRSGFGHDIRATAPPACHYHRVYFSAAILDAT